MTLTHMHAAPQVLERVVVLGAKGFVGAAVCARLGMAGIPTLALARADVDLSSSGAGDALARHLTPRDALVAVAAMAPCRDLDMLIANIAIAKAICDACVKVGVAHVANISSDAVYGDGIVPLTEATPTAPTTLHGAMHLSREIALSAALNCPFVTLRPTLLYGLDDPHNGYGPNRFRRKAASGEDIVLFGEGEERRDHLLVDDLAAVVVKVLQHRSSGTLNVASGSVHSFRSIAEAIVAAAAAPVRIRATPRVGPMPHNGYRPFDISAARAAFPTFEPVQLQDGLRLVDKRLRAGRDA